MDSARPSENMPIPAGIDESASVAQVLTDGPKQKHSNHEDRKRQRAYEQRKRKSNGDVAQMSQNLTKELADCKQQLVDSEASKAQLENKLSKLKRVLFGAQHKMNEEICVGISTRTKAAVKKNCT